MEPSQEMREAWRKSGYNVGAADFDAAWQEVLEAITDE